MNISAGGKQDDVRLLNELRSFSYGVERYHSDHWEYPRGERIDLRKNFMLSENGFAPGNTVYYFGTMKSFRAVTYQSDGTGYKIAFTLRQSWPEHGIADEKCRISTGAKLDCSKEQE